MSRQVFSTSNLARQCEYGDWTSYILGLPKQGLYQFRRPKLDGRRAKFGRKGWGYMADTVAREYLGPQWGGHKNT